MPESEYGLSDPNHCLRNAEFLTPRTRINPSGDGKTFYTVVNVIQPGQRKPHTDSDPKAVTVEVQERINPFDLPFRSLVRAVKWDYKADPFPPVGTPLTLTVFRDRYHQLIVTDPATIEKIKGPGKASLNLSGHQCPIFGPDHAHLPAGTYQCEIGTSPFGYKVKWVQVKGTTIGAGINSILQWSGEAWADTETVLKTADGKQVFPLDGPYTLEQLQYKIDHGFVTDPGTILKCKLLLEHRKKEGK